MCRVNWELIGRGMCVLGLNVDVDVDGRKLSAT